MGKRNRKAKQQPSQGTESDNLPRNVKRECLELATQLLERCQAVECSNQCCGGASRSEWDTYMELHQLVNRLRLIQANYVMKPVKRKDKIDNFVSWLKEQGVDTSLVSIQEYEYGLGLRAEREIEEHELMLSIPRKVMMTTQTAQESVLGSLIEKDRILQSMPNIVLALHLLCEKNNETSFWKPYLDVLPETYSTPLYFSPEDVQLLKGSPVFDEALTQFRSIARQYAYFFKLLNSPGENKIPFKVFCYDDYRWAVSTIMTRQNQIPSPAGDYMLAALIPLWDMANHANGQLTTDFNLELDCSKCFSLRHYQIGEQVFIFYGSRSNGELLLHSGFVYPQNQCDRITIKLGISKNDPLFNMKAEILARLTLLPSRQFNLYKGVEPVDSDTLAYLRVFNMKQEELKHYLVSEYGSKHVGGLRDFGEIVSVNNEDKVWSFLETRAQLLIRAYPTSVQEDQSLLQGDTLSAHQRLAVQLRLLEKKILNDTANFSREYRAKMQQQLEEQLQQIAAAKAERSEAMKKAVDLALDDLEKVQLDQDQKEAKEESELLADDLADTLDNVQTV